MNKKGTDLFGGVTLNDIMLKLVSGKNLQSILDKTFEQMMKVKARLDSVMPLALGAFNLPSADDVKRLNNEIAKLDAKLEMLLKLSSKNKKTKKKQIKKVKTPTQANKEESVKDTSTQNTQG